MSYRENYAYKPAFWKKSRSGGEIKQKQSKEVV
jgi:hypothetical protein